MKCFLASCALLATVAAVPVAAAPIKYELAGAFSGIFVGVPYIRVGATVTGLGNTDNAVVVANATVVPLTSLTVFDGIKTFKLAPGYSFIVSRTPFGGAIGFTNFVDSTPVIIASSTFATYDGVSDFVSRPAIFLASQPFNTNRGGIINVLGADVSFSAVTSVPEPASWMLLIAGFGMTGFGMRRRARAVSARA